MTTKGIEAVQVGQAAAYTRTVSEADVSAFAELSGDRHPLHVDETFATASRFGRRVVHGALLVAFMSAASTCYLERYLAGEASRLTVWYGFDRIRFIKPAFIGDTLTVEYRIAGVDAGEEKVFADVSCQNQAGEVVAVARHILKFVS